MWLLWAFVSPAVAWQTAFSLKKVEQSESGCLSCVCAVFLKIICRTYSLLLGFFYLSLKGFPGVLFLTFLNLRVSYLFLVKRIESLFISLIIIVRLKKECDTCSGGREHKGYSLTDLLKKLHFSLCWVITIFLIKSLKNGPGSRKFRKD